MGAALPRRLSHLPLLQRRGRGTAVGHVSELLSFRHHTHSPEARGRTGEPDGSTTHLRGATNAAERVGRAPLRQQVGVLVQVDRRHASSNVPGRDAVDSDLGGRRPGQQSANVRRHERATHILGTPFSRQVSAHLEDSRLGSIVGNPVVVTVDNRARHGRIQDNRPVDILLQVHLTGGCSGSQEDTGGVDVKDLQHEKEKVSARPGCGRLAIPSLLRTRLKSSTG